MFDSMTSEQWGCLTDKQVWVLARVRRGDAVVVPHGTFYRMRKRLLAMGYDLEVFCSLDHLPAYERVSRHVIQGVPCTVTCSAGARVRIERLPAYRQA